MIGVVGLGVVGKATAKLFDADDRPVLTYDINGSGNCASLGELASKASITFVCVPTPLDQHHELDTTIVASVCRDLHEHADGSHVTVVRSTVPIGTCAELCGCVVYNPEFCNARSALADMMTADRVILGGPEGGVQRVRRFYDSVRHWNGLSWQYELMGWEAAEAVKIVTNTAMAVKIAFANEAAFLCKKLGADWKTVSSVLARDKRLGSVGFQVPGPDGQYGFGGACLPKDLAGYIAQCKSVGATSAVVEAVERQNKHIRGTMASWMELIDNLLAEEGKP